MRGQQSGHAKSSSGVRNLVKAPISYGF
jgi:hypothetical protein